MRIQKSILTIIAMLLFSGIMHIKAFSQNLRKIDSLKQVIIRAYPDSNLLKTYSEIAKLYENTVADTALRYYTEAAKLADSLGLNNYKAKILSKIGLIYYYKSNYDTSLFYMQKALNINNLTGNKKAISHDNRIIGIIYKDIGNYNKALEYFNKSFNISEEIIDKAGMADALGRIGNILSKTGIYDNAMKYYIKALELDEEINNKNGIANDLMNIAVINKNMGNYDIALKYNIRALKIKKELNKKFGVAAIYGNIGIVYFKKNDYDKATEYGLKALEIYKKYGNKNGVAINLGNIGDVYISQKKYYKALQFNKKALKINEEIKNKHGIAINLYNIGNIYNKLSKYQQALNYEFNSLDIAKEIGELKIQLNAYAYISDSYIGLKNYKKALKFKNKWIIIYDSIFNTGRANAIAALEFQYKNDKQKQQIKLQQAELEKSKAEMARLEAVKKRKETERNFFIVAFAFMIILTTVIFYYYRQKKKAHAILIKQKYKINKINEELNKNNEELTATLETLQQTQQQLVQAEKMASLGVLAAGIAHEINNPINFVYAGINSLLRDFEDIKPVIEEIGNINPETDNLKEKLKKIEQLKKENYFDDAFKAIPEIISGITVGADRTAEIVKSLRNFSRTDSDKMLPFNIHEVLDTSLLLLKNKYKNKAKIFKNYDTDIPEVQGHPGKMNQAFLNILSNAIDAVENTGEIRITTSLENDYVKISIKDNGCGMSKETKEKIFDPFYTTKDVGKGTGLGMSITYGIITEHNGQIRIISEQGKGTEIITTLPVKQK